MMTKLLCTILLGVLLRPATAQEHWSFKWMGFEDVEIGGFLPMMSFEGEFESAGDADHDGLLAGDELSAFDFTGPQYAGKSCAVSPHCSLTGFSYDLRTGHLALSVLDYDGDYPDGLSTWTRFVSGEGLYLGYRDQFGSSERIFLAATGQTRFEITPAPVPEPAAGVMFMAGIALLACRLPKLRLKRQLSHDGWHDLQHD